jgi:aminoglycoside 6'-N-acetyltransferase
MTPLDPARLAFRPCTQADFPLLHEWFHAPHAERWFGRRSTTLDDVVREYSEYVDGTVAIHVYIVLYDAVPIGMMTWERFGDFADLMMEYKVTDPKAVNCDVLIGEPSAAHRGLGTRLVLRFLREIVYVDPSLTDCFIDPEKENVIAIKTYEKAGFRFVRDIYDDDGIAIHLMVASRQHLTQESQPAMSQP